MWLTLADRLNTPLQRLQQETSSTEFILWMEYLDQVCDEPSRSDYYLMQISSCIDRQNMTKAQARKLKISDYKLKSETPKPKKKKRTVAEAAAEAKSFFGGLLGIKH